MEAAQFSNLFVNINCLAELALRAVEQELEQSGASPENVGDPQDPDFDAQLAASFEGLDMSALDDLNLGGDSNSTPAPEALSDANTKPSPTTGQDDAPADAEAFHLSRYMANAYGYQEQISPRIEAASQRADHEQLSKLLGQLPAELPALTQQLSGEQVENWLELYQSNLPPLDELVVEIRRLDMGA